MLRSFIPLKRKKERKNCMRSGNLPTTMQSHDKHKNIEKWRERVCFQFLLLFHSQNKKNVPQQNKFVFSENHMQHGYGMSSTRIDELNI